MNAKAAAQGRPRRVRILDTPECRPEKVKESTRGRIAQITAAPILHAARRRLQLGTANEGVNHDLA